MNKETAIAQYQLGATDIDSPLGTLQYELIGYTPEGTPRYRQKTTYSEDQQKLLDLQEEGLINLGEAGVAQAGRVRDTLDTPFSLDAARSKQITDIQQKLMDPMWQKRQEQLEADLLARGIRPGQEAYINAHKQFESERSAAYDQMFLDAYKTTSDYAFRERGLPLEELSALLRGPTGAAPATQAPMPGVAPVDYAGLVSELFKTQQSGYNAQMGAIGAAAGAAGQAFGGWAGGGFKGPKVA